LSQYPRSISPIRMSSLMKLRQLISQEF